MTEKIKDGEKYFVVSHDYEGLDIMSVVTAYIDMVGIFCVYEPEYDRTWYGYIKPHDLLTADQILRLRDEHLMLVDAFERHG